MASITFGDGPNGFSLVFSFTRFAIFGCSPGTYGCNSLTSELQYLLIFHALQVGAGVGVVVFTWEFAQGWQGFPKNAPSARPCDAWAPPSMAPHIFGKPCQPRPSYLQVQPSRLTELF